jgi:signal transduction histidine kinase
MARWWKSLSIGTRLHVLIQGALIVILLSLQAVINVLLEKDVLAQARARTAVSADGVINGMNMLMVTGMISNADNRQLYIRKMGASANVRELRIIRAKQVQDQYGPGMPEEQPRDDMDRDAMRTAKPQFRMLVDDDVPLLRAVVPFVVSTNFRGTNCLMCHHAEVGSVNGAASITVDLSEDFEFLGRIHRILWGTQAGLQLLLFAVIGVMTRSITRPLHRLQQAMEKIVTDETWRAWKPVEPQDRLDEVGRLTASFNRMGAAMHEKVTQLNEAWLTQERNLAELRAANEELESFSYTVAHDLRAPLRAMGGFSQALLEDYAERIDGGARVYLDQIIRGSEQLGELIDGLLQLSRSTQGELRRDRIDLSELALAILAELARADPSRTVTWKVEAGLTVRADARMIEAVLRNLLGNAWKFTASVPAARIRVYATDDGAQREYCVSDNGIGFDMTHAEKLFQPFQRLHRQDEVPGIGIGLATVQRIVHRHGGQIRAASAPGKGALFCFSLPFSGDDSAGAVHESQDDAAGRGQSAGRVTDHASPAQGESGQSGGGRA